MKPSEISSQFASVLERAIATIEAESSALRERRPYRVAELQARKGMVLYELDRLSAAVPTPTDGTIERVKRLRAALAENRRLLGLNVTALQEVIETLQQLQLGEESDGTYCAQTVLGSRQR